MDQITGNPPPKWTRGLAAILLCLAIPPSYAASDEPPEYQVKAAFLLNFTKFIEWPTASFEAPDSPITICVLDDPFGGALDQLVAGEVVNGRKVAVQRIKHTPAPKTCQVLFISRSQKEAAKILPTVGPGVLTVGEGTRFIRDGGIIAFVLENRRVRFDVNTTAAENARLKVSSKLLNVARSVGK